MIDVTQDPARLVWSGASLLAFVWLSWARLKPKPRVTAASCLVRVLYASQTGQAEAIARRTHARLIAGGVDAGLASLADMDASDLQSAQTLLIVASTTGDGDAPDEGRAFDKALAARPDLSRQSFAVLALGDRQYTAFCAFGLRVHAGLQACGATALSPCLTADDLDAATLSHWEALLDGLGGGAAPKEAPAPLWTLTERARLNPDSPHPLYRLRLTPHIACDWQAGDLIELETPDGHRRDYSIASLPAEGHAELYVREATGPDGFLGKGSGLLLHDTAEGDTLRLRLKSHKNFHAPAGDGPLLLIGAGSGLAGLRAHIMAAQKRPIWLVYGERNPHRDVALPDEAHMWIVQRKLSHLSLAFSRPDDGEKTYVQDMLMAEGARVYDHLIRDGAVLICGGFTMGRAVDKALRDLMGDAWTDNALLSGRYRRDLY
ncbi:MAG: NADPH cytochrome P450 oxidoreductase family protein [Asticcacaulis sp.]|uniref:NADPH cytochrome P450 oxidoreductase family protein n=1 Tax=Asticcacaulis sp. TaxID=1872648 RepID=UPI003F7B8982